MLASCRVYRWLVSSFRATTGCGTVSLTLRYRIKGYLSAKCWVLRWPGPEKGRAPVMPKPCFFSLLPCGEHWVCLQGYSLSLSYDPPGTRCCYWSLFIRATIEASPTCLGAVGAEEFCGDLKQSLRPRFYYVIGLHLKAFLYSKEGSIVPEGSQHRWVKKCFWWASSQWGYVFLPRS